MALPLSNTFEGGSNGTAISAANSGGTSGDAWNTITGTAPVFSTDHAKDGTLSGKWVIPSGTKTSSLRWTGFGSLTTDVWGRAYLWISAAPTTDFRLIAARNNSGSGSAFIGITTAGVLRILNAAQTTVATGTVTIATGQWVRVEWRVRSATTNGQVEVWLFNNPDSTTADDHFSTTTAVLAANTDQMEHGVCTNAGQAAYTFYLDGIAASSTAAIGPEAGNGNASGSVPTLTLSAATASATGDGAGSGDPGTLTLSAATATATGGGSASGSIPTLTLSGVSGSASGGGGVDGNASGSLATLTLSAATATATGDGGATGNIPTFTLVAPAAAAAGTAQASGGISTLTLSAPTASASGGGVTPTTADINVQRPYGSLWNHPY